jgi:hypothetical protein
MKGGREGGLIEPLDRGARTCDALFAERGVKDALFRLYQGSFKALLRLYQDFQALSRLYLGSNKALLRLYYGSLKALFRLS